MILYKYVSFEAGLKILEKCALGFSHLEDFNDPFEATALGLTEGSISQAVRFGVCRNRLSRKYAVLSLTRAPLNPLMWSHYGDCYKGMVIGIDTVKAGFENDEQYIIPAHRGEIIYVNTAPKATNNINDEDLMAIGDSSVMSWKKHERFLKHAFLYKSVCWAYEEEVRIVKNISSANFTYHYSSKKEEIIDGLVWNRLQLETRPIYLRDIPEEAFMEIYIGENCYRDQMRKQKNKAQQDVELSDPIERLKATCQRKSISLYRVGVDVERWLLMKQEIK